MRRPNAKHCPSRRRPLRRRSGKPSTRLELSHGGGGVLIGEEAAVAVVGGAAGDVEDPVRGFERDPVGIGEVDRLDDVVVDDVGDLAARVLQAAAEIVERFLSSGRFNDT